MKKISIAFLALIGANLYALDIVQAVNIGLENSHKLKQSGLIKSVLQEKLSASLSSNKPSIDVNYNASFQEQNSPSNSVNPSYATISLSYNLFNGYYDKYAIKGAMQSVQNSEYKKEALKSDLKLVIQLAYINYLEKKETLSSKEEAVKLVEKSLSDTQAYYDEGLVAKNSLLETKVSLSKTIQDLLVSRSQLFIAKKSLERLIGQKIDEEIKDVNFDVVSIENSDVLINKGLKYRSEIKSSNIDIKIAKYASQSTNSYKYPKLDLVLTHTQNGVDGKLGGRDYMYDNQTNASLNISYNLYSGGAHEAKRAESLYQTQILQEKLQELKLDVTLQIQKAKEAYALALENAKVTKNAKAYAQENFEIVEKRYKSQLEKTTDFLKARLELSQAKIADIKSLYNIYSQYATLLRVTGK